MLILSVHGLHQDGYFQQPQREAASSLRHRWVAAMALVVVHALLIVSLLLVHAAVKATSVAAASGGAGLREELLDMPQAIENVIEVNTICSSFSAAPA